MSGPARVCCIHVPFFSVQALRRRHPELRGPVAVLSNGKVREGIRALSPEALEAGLCRGMSAVQARAVCPNANILPWNEEVIHAALQDFEELLRGVAPQVTAEGDGTFFLGCRGLEHLFPAESDLLQEISRRIQESAWSISSGIADTRFAAFAAALCGNGQEIVSPRQERQFLAPLPLQVLPMSQTLSERLAGLGLHTLGEFASLPAPSVEARYGLEGIHFHRLARGDDAALLWFTVPEEASSRSIELVASTIEELRQPLFAALESLLDEMQKRGRSVASLAFLFLLENGMSEEIEVTTASPTIRPRIFWDLLYLALQHRIFSAAVERVHVEVSREQRGVGSQGNLFGRATAVGSEEYRKKITAALGWLRGLYGSEAVVQLTLQDSHRPEQCTTHVPYEFHKSSEQSDVHEESTSETLSPMLRLIDPPMPIEAALESQRLLHFRWAGGFNRVRTMIGPERRDGEWWRSPYERDYYQVLTIDGGMFWIYYDRAADRWFLQGLFD